MAVDKQQKERIKQAIKEKAYQIRSERDTQAKSAKGKFITDAQRLLSKQTILGYTLIEKTQFIEECSQFIITQPELYLPHIQSLITLLESENLIIFKLVSYSLIEIFKDITPQYEVNYKQQMERLESKQVKKEERQVLIFETKLYEYYNKFCDILLNYSRPGLQFTGDFEVNPLKQKQQKEKEESEENYQVKQEMKIVGLKCLGELLTNLYHFNNANKIVDRIVFSLIAQNPTLRIIATEKIQELLADKNVGLFNIKFHLLKEMGQILKSRPEKDIPNNFVEILNHVEIDQNFVNKDGHQDAASKKFEAKKKKQEMYKELERAKKDGKNVKLKMKELKKKQKEKTEDERKAEAQMKRELKQELQEAEGQVSPAVIVRNNSQILEKLYYIYFKIIKMDQISKFFNSAINGILKFVHLINVDLIQALIQNLYTCCDILRKDSQTHKNINNLERRLTCIYTIEEIIQGPGSVIEIDDKDAQIKLYQTILDMNKFGKKLKEVFDSSLQFILLKIVDKMFLRKRQFNFQSIASFVKQLLMTTQNLALIQKQQQQDKNQDQEKQQQQKRIISFNEFIGTVLVFTKQVLIKYPKLTRMLDEENYGFGLDMYNDKQEDPQATNAINTTIHQELINISKNTDIVDMQLIAVKILKQEPLPNQISTLQPMEYYEKLKNNGENTEAQKRKAELEKMTPEEKLKKKQQQKQLKKQNKKNLKLQNRKVKQV